MIFLKSISGIQPLSMIPGYSCIIDNLVGGFNNLEKYERQWEGFSHILWTIKHVMYSGKWDTITGWWLSPTPLKKYKSVGIMKFPTEWKNNPFMFQTTNQDIHEPP